MTLLDKVFGKSLKGEGEKLDSPSDQPKEDIELANFVKSRVEEVRSQSSRISHEGVWMTNIAYAMGFDSVFYDTTAKEFKNAQRPNTSLRRNRIHINKILPTIQNRLARLCKNPPRFDVRPKSAGPEDKDAARIALNALRWQYDEQKLNQKRVSLYMWSQQCGHGYLKVNWDGCAGKMMADPITGELDYEGDIRVDVVSPFEVFPDPLAKTLEEAQYIIHAKVRKLDYFKTHYPERGNLVKEEGAWLLSAQFEQRINTINIQGPSQSGVNLAMKNAAIELAYYEKRSKQHPNGRMIVVANGVLLENKDLPVGRIPFALFPDIPIAGKYYPESIVTHLRPVQDQFNRVMNQRAAWVNKILTGKYIAAKGHGIAKEAFNDQSGEIIEYNAVPGAPPPQALQIPVIPAFAYQEEQSLQSQLYDISGINEVSRGQLPSASIPGIGMQLLQEQDETRIGIMTELHEESWAKIFSLMLEYMEKFYEMPRMLKLTGKNSEYMVKEFVGSDIRGNHDVIVTRGSLLPYSKALRRQEIINALTNGLLGNPTDPSVAERAFRAMEFDDLNEFWDRLSLDEKALKEQTDMIEQGEVPEVHEMDNHEFLLDRLNMYRKAKGDSLTPIQKEALQATIELHIEEQIKLVNPAASAENQAKIEQVVQQDQMEAENVTQAPPEAPIEAQGGLPNG